MATYIEYDDDNKDRRGFYNFILAIIYVVFLFWAIILAMKVKDADHRILHIVLAVLASPIYILAYYISYNKM
jgi:hypothetical protein